MRDELERFRRRQTQAQILVVSLLAATGVMFIWLGVMIAQMI
jgi:hypothetical protein